MRSSTTPPIEDVNLSSAGSHEHQRKKQTVHGVGLYLLQPRILPSRIRQCHVRRGGGYARRPPKLGDVRMAVRRRHVRRSPKGRITDETAQEGTCILSARVADADRAWLFLLPCIALSFVVGCSSSPGNPKVPAGAKSSGGKHAVIETDKGSIEIQFLESEAPKAVENFRLLAEHGYYDGLTFHRVLSSGFMIQGGDPAGNGTGGESAWGPAC